MQTATIEVTYVGQPKEGKQYGFIKGADNSTFPVKADRIREFQARIVVYEHERSGNHPPHAAISGNQGALPTRAVAVSVGRFLRVVLRRRDHRRA